jgi:hypothetical protein
MKDIISREIEAGMVSFFASVLAIILVAGIMIFIDQFLSKRDKNEDDKLSDSTRDDSRED